MLDGEGSHGGHGSRRRRLWELDGPVHCPLIGMCLPIATLRRLVDKALGGQAVADDYALHCGAVADCQRRTPIADAVQRELDRRYLPALRAAAKLKSTDALAAAWEAAQRSHDVAGPLWATLTHARCTPALEQRVLARVHMLQHQAGMAARIDLARYDALVDENGVLVRELDTTRQRAARLAAEYAQRHERQQAELVRLRAEVIARDTAIAGLADDLQALQAAVPALKSRVELARRVEEQADRLVALQRQLQQVQDESDRRGRRAEQLAQERAAHQAREANGEPPEAADAAVRLDAQSVLCVGGRPAAVPVYRHIVERVGGRFLHHDGGDEDSPVRLDATLAAADLVICQTGCISHDAYWRVKDHCKRTGKRCVFVETPSTAGLKRALQSLAPEGAANAVNLP